MSNQTPTWGMTSRNDGLGDSPGPLRPDDLSRYRWHTGAEPTPVEADEMPSTLFRDIGPVAMAQFLRTGLRRLAGPITPITYLRTADYREPYCDYGAIGRLIVLRPAELNPWHSGLPHIYIAAANRMPNSDALASTPSGMDLHEAERRLRGVRTLGEVADVFGSTTSQIARAEHLARLDQLIAECAAAERLAHPVRLALQTGGPAKQERVRELLLLHGLTEADLCTAWHHLPRDRRDRLNAELPCLHDRSIPWLARGL
jgi:hypothetical protein